MGMGRSVCGRRRLRRPSRSPEPEPVAEAPVPEPVAEPPAAEAVAPAAGELHGHGTIRLRSAQPAAPEAPPAEVPAAGARAAPSAAAPQPQAAPSSSAQAEYERLAAEAKDAGAAAYAAYNPGRGQAPAGNAGELLAKAAELAAAAAAAKAALGS